VEREGLGRRIRERGREAGLASVGFAPVGPSDHAAFVRRWIAAGRAGAMTWMERTTATGIDPRQRFQWARSAVVASLSYLPYRGPRDDAPGLVRHVARYAVGEDYHRVLGERLERLAAFIRGEAPGARTRVYVDTGPLLERDLAARAGIGWFGKNANLIGPQGDSWILLGVILTDLELSAGEPVADHCGSCTACLDACPTGAITADYDVDARRCISYLTIELRGRIPETQRADLGDWVLGCDVCQEVCPWNHRVEPAADAAFRPGDPLRRRSLADLVRLEEREFQEVFRPTPLERPRRRGLVRNALIVAANTGDGEALAAAEGRLSDPDPVVRGAAAWALGRAGGGRRRALLERGRAGESDGEVRAEIDAALETGGRDGSQKPANSGRLR
jgi:epoxyqueuosine reductase